VLVVALRVDAPAEVPGGASVASLAARLRPPGAIGLRPDDVLKAPVDVFRECMLANDLEWPSVQPDTISQYLETYRSGASVAGETSSATVSVSSVLVRIGVLGMSTVISGRGGRDPVSSRPGALLEDAMINRQECSQALQRRSTNN
jgi:hypothetical protein